MVNLDFATQERFSNVVSRSDLPYALSFGLKFNQLLTPSFDLGLFTVDCDVKYKYKK